MKKNYIQPREHLFIFQHLYIWFPKYSLFEISFKIKSTKIEKEQKSNNLIFNQYWIFTFIICVQIKMLIQRKRRIYHGQGHSAALLVDQYTQGVMIPQCINNKAQTRMVDDPLKYIILCKYLIDNPNGNVHPKLEFSVEKLHHQPLRDLFFHKRTKSLQVITMIFISCAQ